MDVHWTADIGAANAAWLADPGNFDGEQAATDRGDGTVTISREQMDVLRDLEELGEQPGDLGYDEEHGTCLYLPHDRSGVARVTSFWLTQRHGEVPV